jgi:hypothetical protein
MIHRPRLAYTMSVSPVGLLALRIPVAIWASEELHGFVPDCPDPTLVTTLVMGITSALMLGIVFVPPLQRILLAPSRLDRYAPDAYFLIGVVTAVLAIAIANHGIG